MYSASAAVSQPCYHSNHVSWYLIGRARLLFGVHADMSHMQCAERRARRMTIFSTSQAYTHFIIIYPLYAEEVALKLAFYDWIYIQSLNKQRY